MNDGIEVMSRVKEKGRLFSLQIILFAFETILFSTDTIVEKQEAFYGPGFGSLVIVPCVAHLNVRNAVQHPVVSLTES